MKVKKEETDIRTDGRTPDRYLTRSAKHGERNKQRTCEIYDER